MSGSWKGIAAVGAAVGIGVVAGIVALTVRSDQESVPSAQGTGLVTGPVVTVYKSPT